MARGNDLCGIEAQVQTTLTSFFWLIFFAQVSEGFTPMQSAARKISGIGTLFLFLSLSYVTLNSFFSLLCHTM